MANQETVETGYTIKTYQGLLLPEAYTNYIKARWMRSFRRGNDYMKLSDSDAYFNAYSTYINNILNDDETSVSLAVLYDEPDVALGFSVLTDMCLHYIYVGQDYRRQGIGTGLLPTNIREISHLTKIGLELWPKKMPRAVFNPFN